MTLKRSWPVHKSCFFDKLPVCNMCIDINRLIRILLSLLPAQEIQSAKTVSAKKKETIKENNKN